MRCKPYVFLAALLVPLWRTSAFADCVTVSLSAVPFLIVGKDVGGLGNIETRAITI